MYRIYKGECLDSSMHLLLYASVGREYLVLTIKTVPTFEPPSEVIHGEYESLDEAVAVLKDFFDCNVPSSHKSFCICADFHAVASSTYTWKLDAWKNKIRNRDRLLA